MGSIWEGSMYPSRRSVPISSISGILSASIFLRFSRSLAAASNEGPGHDQGGPGDVETEQVLGLHNHGPDVHASHIGRDEDLGRALAHLRLDEDDFPAVRRDHVHARAAACEVWQVFRLRSELHIKSPPPKAIGERLQILLVHGSPGEDLGGTIRPAAMFRSFDETFVLQRYLDVFARSRSEVSERPVGMVMPFDGFEGGMLVHNGDFDAVSTKLIHDVPGNTPPHRVIVEPFISLINYLARSGWTPESPPSAPRRHQQGRARSGASVAPWMVRLLG
jgi:hypothetical protein